MPRNGRRRGTRRSPAAVAALTAALLPVSPLAEQPRLDAAYVATPPQGVEFMLDMAGVGPGDYVIDLGTGDGRIAIAAATRGAEALGVDIDPLRVAEARSNALDAGVSPLVSFREQDLFQTDLAPASVVTLFLNEAVNLRLRPKLLAALRPGSRVVSHNFDMGDWPPDEHRRFLNRVDGNVYLHDLFLWVVPADIGGTWTGSAGDDALEMRATQHYQHVSLAIALDGRRIDVDQVRLLGNRIRIAAHDPRSGAALTLDGSLDGGRLAGQVYADPGGRDSASSWHAERRAESD